jgi:hypothetical protein
MDPPTNTSPAEPSKADTAPSSHPNSPMPAQASTQDSSTTAKLDAVYAKFPEFHAWMKQQEAEIERLVPAPIDEAEWSRKLEEGAKWLKEQDRLMQENREWLKSQWTRPASPSPEDVKVRFIIKNLHLYHVKDDSDIERIKAMLAQRNAATADQPQDSATKDEPRS